MPEDQVPPGLRITNSTGETSEGSIPPGFDKNPTAWPRRILVALLSLAAGLCVSVYLALFQIDVLGERVGPVLPESKGARITSAFRMRLWGRWPMERRSSSRLSGGGAGGAPRRGRCWLSGFVICSGALVSVLLIWGMQAFLVNAWCTLCLGLRGDLTHHLRAGRRGAAGRSQAPQAGAGRRRLGLAGVLGYGGHWTKKGRHEWLKKTATRT